METIKKAKEHFAKTNEPMIAQVKGTDYQFHKRDLVMLEEGQKKLMLITIEKKHIRYISPKNITFKQENN